MEEYTIKPPKGFKSGDRVYCVQGTCETRPTLERGKVYEVEAVRRFSGLVDQGLRLVGVRLPPNAQYIRSGRFLKLERGKSALQQINAATRRSWTAAYYASTGRDEDTGIPYAA